MRAHRLIPYLTPDKSCEALFYGRNFACQIVQPPDGQVQGTAAFTWSKSIDVKTVRKDVDDDILIHQYVKTFSRVQSVSGRMVKPV
jgi:hypothetical protein